jgi:hypothetical protein
MEVDNIMKLIGMVERLNQNSTEIGDGYMAELKSVADKALLEVLRIQLEPTPSNKCPTPCKKCSPK